MVRTQKFCTASLEKVATTSPIYNVKVAFKVEEMLDAYSIQSCRKSWLVGEKFVVLKSVGT